MDFKQYTDGILAQLQEDLQIKIISKGKMHSLLLEGRPREAEYLIEFYEVDGAGTLGIKMRYIIGKVCDFQEVLKCLVLNSREYVDYGPLFTAIDPRGQDEILFLLVGQLILPPNTPAEEVSTLFRNNAMMNYLMFSVEYPGVQLFQ
jgi:hypothetical protein